jgi:hypothetical protein
MWLTNIYIYIINDECVIIFEFLRRLVYILYYIESEREKKQKSGLVSNLKTENICFNKNRFTHHDDIKNEI